MKKTIMTLTIGLALGFALNQLLNDDLKTLKNNADEPLYWVAPMDDNYRRDKPGKSPMGMDLIPVYKDAANSNGADGHAEHSNKTSLGTVSIAPHIVNNLGVRTAPVTAGLLNQSISTTGFVQYDEEKWVHIHPRVEGWIEKLFVKAEGERVQSGEPIYTLYSPQLVNAQEELVIALNRNNDSLIKAAKARLAALHVPNRVIQHLVKTKTVVQNVTFYAPQSGVVNELNIREGFFVKPSNTLMSIAQPEHVWIEAEILAQQANVVKLNQLVTISVDYLPGKEWQGVINYIYPSLDQVTKTVRARINIHNPELTLKPNMFANIKIAAQGAGHGSDSIPSLLVPSEAVIRTGQQNRVVLALGQGKFKSVEVKLGVTADNTTQILAGLSLGDNVVTSAQFLIDSESSVKSDFKRISQEQKPSATVNGIINSINKTDRTLNISREAIEKWNRGPATMDFYLDFLVDINTLSEGQHINFTFEIRDEFTIVAISPIEPEAEMEMNMNMEMN